VAAATELPAIAGFNEIASEIGWLSRVARAFTGSPVVAAVDVAPAHGPVHRPAQGPAPSARDRPARIPEGAP
jgi:hypothetical protein